MRYNKNMLTVAKKRKIFSLSNAAVRVFNAGIGLHPMHHSAETIQKALCDLRPLQGNALLIGGMAVIEHGYSRYTEDLDLLYRQSDVKIFDRLSKHFEMEIKAESGWHQLKHKETGVRLELIPGGAIGQYGFLPYCDDVAGTAGYISLAGLIWLKLIARRLKDQADVAELYKRKPEEVEAVREHLPEQFRAPFDVLVANARREMADDPYKNHQNRPHEDDDGDVAAALVSEAPAAYPKARKPARKARK